MDDPLLSEPPQSQIDIELIDEEDGAFIEMETSKSVRKALSGLGLRRSPRSDTAQIKDRVLNSLDYSLFASAVNLSYLRERSDFSWKWLAVQRFFYCLAIGIVVALLATATIYATKHLQTLRLNFLSDVVGVDVSYSSEVAILAYLKFASVSMAFAFVSAVVVSYVEPLAAGSGIPELKSLLNGINQPRIMRIKTLVAKLVALPLAIASGLPVGYEGPMAHIGAATAAGLTQGKTLFCGFDVSVTKKLSKLLRLDGEKRDFICAGAAAGISAAFNAPAGAVIFILEEAGAAHWHRGLLWRAFITSVTASYIIDFLLSGLQGGAWGTLTASGMFTFGVSTTASQAWALWELPLFITLGAIGGLLGALFVSVNSSLLSMRLRNVLINRRRRVAEVVLLSVLVATLAFFTPLLFGVCKSIPLPSPGSADDDGAHHLNEASIPLNLVRLNCGEGEFNDLASLWLTSPENSIRTLFHTTNGNFSPISLGLYGLTYFLCMCLTTGSAVPAGLFIPSLLVGSAMGRSFGEACSAVLPRDFSVRAGTYALIGAAAILGGVMRMSLSMTVILLETTGNSFLALPIMIALITSRGVGDVFEVGIYDMMIKKYAWPVLDEDIDRRSSLILQACDVMISPPLVVHEITRVGTLHDTLLHCSHNGFPVIFKRDQRSGSNARTGSLAGYIQRRHLSVILEKREFATAARNDAAGRGSSPNRRIDSSAESSYTSLSSLGKSGIALDPLLPGVSVTRATRSPSSRSRGIPRSGSIIIQEPQDTEVHHTMEDALAVVEASATVVHSINSVNSPIDAGTIIGVLERPVPRALGGSDVRSAAAYTHKARPYAGGDRESPGLRKSTSGQSLAGSVDSFCPLQKELEYDEEPALRAEDFNAFYPRFPDVRALHFSPQERDMWIDLRPYADLAPVTVHAHAPLERVHRLFSSMGLRHLLVINDAYDVVGVITRHDLSPMRIAAVAQVIEQRRKQSRK